MKAVLVKLGMSPVGSDFATLYPADWLPVMLDGRLMGYIDPSQAERLVHSLRVLKIQQLGNEFDCVPPKLEIAHLPLKEASDT